MEEIIYAIECVGLTGGLRIVGVAIAIVALVYAVPSSMKEIAK